MNQRNQPANSAVRIIAALIFAGLMLSGSFWLKVNAYIGETSFVTLSAFACFTCTIVTFSHRIESFAFKITGIDVKLAKIESIRKDVERREQSIRRVGLSLAQIVMFTAAFSRRATDIRENDLEAAWLSKKAKELLSEIDATKEESSAVFRYIKQLPELDALFKTDSKKAKEKWEAIWNDIANET